MYEKLYINVVATVQRSDQAARSNCRFNADAYLWLSNFNHRRTQAKVLDEWFKVPIAK